MFPDSWKQQLKNQTTREYRQKNYYTKQMLSVKKLLENHKIFIDNEEEKENSIYNKTSCNHSTMMFENFPLKLTRRKQMVRCGSDLQKTMIDLKYDNECGRYFNFYLKGSSNKYWPFINYNNQNIKNFNNSCLYNKTNYGSNDKKKFRCRSLPKIIENKNFGNNVTKDKNENVKNAEGTEEEKNVENQDNKNEKKEGVC